MNLLQVNNEVALAECVAKMTIEMLKAAIKANGEAVWVLGGGKTPLLSYEIIADKYSSSVDWQKVWFFVSDERHVEFSSPDSNWGAIEAKLLPDLSTEPSHLLKPAYFGSLDEMAENYRISLDKLPQGDDGLPRFDVVWLGTGEDGHTLSVFPGSKFDGSELVSSVKDSPKLPAERITLTLASLRQAQNCLIVVNGEAKAQAVQGLINNDESLPICLAAQTIENSGGKVCLLVDKQASALISN